MKKLVLSSKLLKVLIIGLMLSVFSTMSFATELTMFYPVAVGGPLTKLVDKLVSDFQAENPDIKVKAIYSGNYSDTMTKAMTALKGGTPPNLSVILSTEIFTLIDNDAIVPFDDLVTTDQEKQWLGSFYPALMENSRTAGKTWSIPFQRSTIVMYYNKDAFRKAGLNPDAPPATWDELVEMGKKLVVKDSAGKVTQWGLEIPSTGYPYWMFGALCRQNGEVLMNTAGTEVYFKNPGVVQALDFWKDLGQTHGIMPKGTIEWGTLRTDFLEQKTAIMWHSTGNLTAVKKNASFDFGVAMLPAKKERGTPTGGGNFYIFKDSSPEERAAALKFIKWMTQPARTAQWSIGTGYLGTRADAYETDELKSYVKGFPAAAIARDQLKYATAELSVHENGRVYKILNDAIQAALTGSKTPEAALQGAQKQTSRILKRY
ncbi:MAG: ABC transporter substrate-binding protein [Deltaproteobacteria bacterium]|jgi:sn-glycerol 3-phosphate transport system substrate-binding protein|uniref:ABC transporter substrate-binding protein n=1 Tax=Desulfobacula sp. TaxID=2593537 RepID=UPI001E0050F4|nr:ABC transporter substrate-binding protein [Desulfobacula sp.]MBT4874380.1 ABC transporter substrate-binding protein [Desulfobacula sp.]MBT5543425.1 ABC transporter substrate-binding protein [Desulfobacula sp.]MBT7710543.1 ABC transporter substrate-binding protein [Deltaproteobacteria bacterium]MBT7889810.1 ABC transporter substrate-binding protein [Deltaproteobacteria bacterium]